jgi:hypothetical protein
MNRSHARDFWYAISCYASACLLAVLAGCATWYPPQEPVKGGIADTDETLKTPLRAAPAAADEKLPWWDMRNILDPRSRDIERNLGV